MGRVTEPTPNKFSKSMGIGIGAIVGGGNYFVLEQLSNTSSFPSGHREQVIVNYVELGRSPKCGIRFKESEKTVSRRHAAIQKEGNQYVLIQLSKTNPTILNGRPVNRKWYLQNGDEIQLSVEGPKMNFIIPTNRKSKSIGLSHRLSLFRRQALRPYKKMVTALAVVLFFAITGGGYYLYDLNGERNVWKNKFQKFQLLLDSMEQNRQALIDSITTVQGESQATIDELTRKFRDLEKGYQSSASANQTGSTTMTLSADFSDLHKDICYIIGSDLVVTLPDGTTQDLPDYGWSGTGFLTNDGKFVTARHVVEPWYYPESPEYILLNTIVAKGGSVRATINALAPDGRALRFSSNNFKLDRSMDVDDQIPMEGGGEINIRHAKHPDAFSTDWAWTETDAEGGLIPAYISSTQIPQATQLFLFGYPLRTGVQTSANSTITSITPIYAKTDAASDGLIDGCILSTTVSFDSGNSGGPVFIEENGKNKVIGIVSGANGRAIGRFVPISKTES